MADHSPCSTLILRGSPLAGDPKKDKSRMRGFDRRPLPETDEEFSR
jgi:hypothetical protein